ncbi:MAG TPA: formylglycine-generating enzyme family protein [Thermoguttaceae bacterium]|nr:formylglycine-generating enzyme family protein [Thermoguttaceae bacterium]
MKNCAIWPLVLVLAVLTGCGEKELDTTAPSQAPAPVAEKVLTVAEKVITNSFGMKMVLIPPGEFMMGSPENEKDREDGEKQHRVRITKAFYLGVYEVTVEDFRRFVDATGYKTDAERIGFGRYALPLEQRDIDTLGTWRNHPAFNQEDNHPVVNVSWNDAVAYCEWISDKEGQTYRLPTEAEWEYACRAGTTTRYYHGDDEEGLTEFENVADAAAKEKKGFEWALTSSDGYVFTSPVGSFRPNGFGLYDMHGNVREWCQDGADDNDYYESSPTHDPMGPASGEYRVCRGGNWSCAPMYCRSAARNCCFLPNDRFDHTGFRLAAVPVNASRREEAQPEDAGGRSTAPTFADDVPEDVREVVKVFLSSYEEGDAERAYACLETPREKLLLVNAFSAAQIPIMNPKVRLINDAQLQIEYEMPHPGDIIVAVLEGGEDIELVKRNLRELRTVSECVSKTETWSVVRDEGAPKLDYGDKGVLKFAYKVGGDVHRYTMEVQSRQYLDEGKGPLTVRSTGLMAYYVTSFNVPEQGPEVESLMSEILPKLVNRLVEVAHPSFTIKVPVGWTDILKRAGQPEEDTVVFVHRTAGFVIVTKELIIAESRALKDKPDSEVLSVAHLEGRDERTDKVIDTGDSTVGGVPAKFMTQTGTFMGEDKQRMVRYVFIYEKVLYSLKVGCQDAQFDATYDLLMRIKNSFRFRKRY